MKKYFMLITLVITSLNSFAIETGFYTNLNQSDEVSTIYKKINVRTDECQAGGYTLDFKDSNPDAPNYNFCNGYKNTVVTKLKKCRIKEYFEMPFHFCFGGYKEVEMVQSTEVKVNTDGTEYTLTETTTIDKKLTGIIIYKLSEIPGQNNAFRLQLTSDNYEKEKVQNFAKFTYDYLKK